MIRFLMALVATIWVGAAANAATYNVDMMLDQQLVDLSSNSPAAGAMSVTGTIETDGTLGWLQSSNIVAWSFTLNVAGQMSQTISSSTQGGSTVTGWIKKMWADTSALVSNGSFSFGEQSLNTGSAANFSRLSGGQVVGGMFDALQQTGFAGQMGGSGFMVMATRPNGPVTPAPVPLPAPILMLGAALAGLFGMRRFQRGEMVAA